MRNGAQLITYADRLGGGDLSTLREVLTGPLEGVFTGVHILPFYRPFDRADAGFDPIDHRSVDPRLGDWDRVRAIAATHDVTADLIVNHISDESPQFIDFLERGDGSEHAGMFLAFDNVFPEGATEADLLGIYRPRPQLPFTVFNLADGTRRVMWTTFTPNQVDLDVDDEGARAYLGEILDRLALAGVSQVRLDAIGYAVKEAGTTCFMTDGTRRFIADISSGVRSRGMEALLEIHSHHLDQRDAARDVDRVYDFALPPLVLYALHTGSAAPIRRWLEIAPRNAMTVLDTHDGIGVVDVGPTPGRPGLLDASQIDELVESIHRATGGESRLATGVAASNLDVYQVNSTYYSAVGEDPDAYLLARLTQFLSPGIPQVYYAGLLAASNAMGLLEETGVGRDVNRPYFDVATVEARLALPVVRDLLRLIRFRNTHPAFGGRFTVGGTGDTQLTLGWRDGDAHIEAEIDFAARRFTLTHSDGLETGRIETWDGF